MKIRLEGNSSTDRYIIDNLYLIDGDGYRTMILSGEVVYNRIGTHMIVTMSDITFVDENGNRYEEEFYLEDANDINEIISEAVAFEVTIKDPESTFDPIKLDISYIIDNEDKFDSTMKDIYDLMHRNLKLDLKNDTDLYYIMKEFVKNKSVKTIIF